MVNPALEIAVYRLYSVSSLSSNISLIANNLTLEQVDTLCVPLCVFISPETGSQKTNKIKQNKYTARESNTIPAATLRVAIGMIWTNTELFQWLRIYIQKKVQTTQ